VLLDVARWGRGSLTCSCSRVLLRIALKVERYMNRCEKYRKAAMTYVARCMKGKHDSDASLAYIRNEKSPRCASLRARGHHKHRSAGTVSVDMS